MTRECRPLRLCCAAMLAGIFGAGCSARTTPEVVAYVAVDQPLAEPILKDFQSQSGIAVRAVYDAEAAKTSGLVARLLGESNHPRCDVFWNNEPVQTFLLADRQVLDPYLPPGANDLAPEFRAPDGAWTAVGARARVIVYNTKYVSREELPRSLFDLVKPQWRGKVAIANPQFGTTRTHVAALFVALGPERAQQLLRDLLANGARIVDGNAMVKNLVARAHPDASPIYLGLTDTDDVFSGQADGEPIDLVYPDQDSLGTLVVPATVCLIRGSPHSQAARQLLDYLVSPEVERQLVAGRAAFLPLRDNVALSEALARHGRPRAMRLSPPALLEQLEPSSRWTKEHFHP